MKQPELGRKIAELRKAKGLTQEELVQKCNLSVRTLQRIEAGEVSPRSYTVRIIFAALEYNVHDSSKRVTGWFIQYEPVITGWLGQFYRYVLDLFNLKTNTMKKITILSVPFLILCAALFLSFGYSARAQARVAIRAKFEKVSSNEKFVQLFNSGQIDSVAFQYLEHACMMPGQYSSLNARKDIADYYRSLYTQGLRFAKLKTVSRVISDSLAIDRGVWEISLNSVVVARGTYLTQWHYLHGNWWIENEMSKSDTEAPEEANR